MFDGGHAGTGLSIAEGLATARDLRHGLERIAVVVGDAALMSGLSLEALNDIGHRKTQLLIVLNDNEMSISPTVGALLEVPLARSSCRRPGSRARPRTTTLVGRIPVVGPTVARAQPSASGQSVVNFAQPGQLFEDLGITYIGVVPGHDIRALLSTFSQALELKGPVIVHVRTQKGRGYTPAETDQVGFHGAALPPMAVPTTEQRQTVPPNLPASRAREPGYADRIDGRRRRPADRRPRHRRSRRTTRRSSSRS